MKHSGDVLGMNNVGEKENEANTELKLSFTLLLLLVLLNMMQMKNVCSSVLATFYERSAICEEINIGGVFV